MNLSFGVTLAEYRRIEPTLTRPLSLGPRRQRLKNPLDGLDIVTMDEYSSRKDRRGF